MYEIVHARVDGEKWHSTITSTSRRERNAKAVWVLYIHPILGSSALPKEAILGHRLVVARVPVRPRREVRVRVSLDVPEVNVRSLIGLRPHEMNVLVDVCGRGEVLGIATDVDVVRVLINADVVDLHDRREGDVLEVYKPEVVRHS